MQDLLPTIEEALKVGQVSPPQLADYKDWLAAESSRLMDRQLELQIAYAEFYEAHRNTHKSDKGLSLHWKRTPLGLEEMTLDTRQKKIKILREAISSHLRIADLVARNLV